MSFQVMLREGIVGGFVGPTVKQMVQIQGDHTGAIIQQQTLKPGSKTDFHVQSGGIATEQVSEILEKIKQELQDLPTEQPPGSEDIYGQDISLAFMHDDFQWINGGPEGCSNGVSTVQPTDEQKEKFKELVELVKGLGQQYAIEAQ